METEAALVQTMGEQLAAPYADGEQLLPMFQEYHARQTRAARLRSWENTSLITTEARRKWWTETQRAIVPAESETASYQHAMRAMSPQVPSSNSTSAAMVEHQGSINSRLNSHAASAQLASSSAGHARYF